MCAHALDESLGVANEEKATRQHIKCFLRRIVQATAMALELYSMELFIIKSTKLVSHTYWNRAEKLDTNVGRTTHDIRVYYTVMPHAPWILWTTLIGFYN